MVFLYSWLPVHWQIRKVTPITALYTSQKEEKAFNALETAGECITPLGKGAHLP